MRNYTLTKGKRGKFISKDTRIARLKALLVQALPELQDSYEAIGGCSHNENICCCSLAELIWNIKQATGVH